MATSHNNTLNTVGLYDSDDDIYAPAKKPTLPNKKALGTSATKRKREGHAGNFSQEHYNLDMRTGDPAFGRLDATSFPPSQNGLSVEHFIGSPSRYHQVGLNTASNVNGNASHFTNNHSFYGNHPTQNFEQGQFSHSPPAYSQPQSNVNFTVPSSDVSSQAMYMDNSRQESNHDHLDRNSGFQSGGVNAFMYNGDQLAVGPMQKPTSLGQLFSEPQADGFIIGDMQEVEIKEEADSKPSVSASSLYESGSEESDLEDQRTTKVPKINKDGAPRKPRRPRAKLLKWSDNDWKNVVLGIIWACGQTGVQIPFDMAAQVVGESCTAGALQQAVLKLRMKQVEEGNEIPSLRMAWTRKNKVAASTTANEQNPQDSSLTKYKKKPTRFFSAVSLIITLKRAYENVCRVHLSSPYKFKKTPRQQQRSRPSSYPSAVPSPEAHLLAQAIDLPSIHHPNMNDGEGYNASASQEDQQILTTNDERIGAMSDAGSMGGGDGTEPEYPIEHSSDVGGNGLVPATMSRSLSTFQAPLIGATDTGSPQRPFRASTHPHRKLNIHNAYIHERRPLPIAGNGNDSVAHGYAMDTAFMTPTSSIDHANSFGTPLTHFSPGPGYTMATTGPLQYTPSTPSNSRAANRAVAEQLQSGAYNPQSVNDYTLALFNEMSEEYSQFSATPSSTLPYASASTQFPFDSFTKSLEDPFLDT